ncbi:MAG TPA: RNA methyltransferase [Myxococcales bacterium]|nr:RNA methyltransferase [Myxococcales bacterium]
MLFAVCAPGLEPVLLSEVRALGLAGRELPSGVEIEGGLPEAMRLNLWLRTASRVLLRLGDPFRAASFAELVKKASALPWERCLPRKTPASFRVACHKSRLYHSGAVAERLHAALEARTGSRVALAEAGEEGRADAQLFLARLERDVCTVSADTSGVLLHQRGWRGPQGKAPLRETLAAALLLAAGYRGEEDLCDPLCGSGTIPIEAALIASRRAPGIGRSFAFQRWLEASARQWEHLTTEARKQERAPRVRIEGSDRDAGAVAAARENVTRAGVEVAIAQRRLQDLPADPGPGLIACNPPYGVRLGGDVKRTLRELAAAARRRPGWKLAVMAVRGSGAELGLRPALRTQSGGIPVEILLPPG